MLLVFLNIYNNICILFDPLKWLIMGFKCKVTFDSIKGNEIEQNLIYNEFLILERDKV